MKAYKKSAEESVKKWKARAQAAKVAAGKAAEKAENEYK